MSSLADGPSPENPATAYPAGRSSSENPATADRSGVRLGLDVGSVRVGVALSDPRGVLAHPVTTVGPDETDRVVALVEAEAVTCVYVGLPRTLRGEEGSAAQAARSYALNLATLVAPVPVRLVDERLTTVTAHRQLESSGVRERGRRPVIDQAAAVLILQGALDLESSSGTPAGELVRRGRKPRHARRRKENG